MMTTTTINEAALAIEATEEIAVYVRALFLAGVRREPPKVQLPETWPLQFRVEVHHLVRVLLDAFSNQSGSLECCVLYLGIEILTERTTWKIGDYEARLLQKGVRCSGQNEKVEAEMMAEFPPIGNMLGREDQPLVITDAEGTLLVWYLPGLISQTRQVCAPISPSMNTD